MGSLSVDGRGSTGITGRSVQFQGTAVMPPLRSRVSAHGARSRQKTCFNRPEWPQYGLSSDTIVSAHPQSAI